MRSLFLGAFLSLSLGAMAEDALQPVDLFELLPPVPPEDNNPWPAAWEEDFRRRARELIEHEAHQPPSASWSGEKSGGGFLAFVKGRRAGALDAMRVQPPPPFADHTRGIDFYWCFHLEKQPRYYFQFGLYLGEEFMARMKEGARRWTAQDPRPNLELVLQLECPDPEVAAHAREQLAKHWRTAAEVREIIAAARSEPSGADKGNKQVFADYLEANLSRWPATRPEDPAGWRSWWKLISDGDWKIYEEYERRVNPRPHPVHGVGTGPVGTRWDPEVRGGWVDWRNTDNLRAMREVSVYLFAEETGNELVRKVYKERIRRSARGFWTVGNGEWDSPAYLGLTVVAYLMLYDFAKDREVRLLAKALLDYLATTAAVKYARGGASGPNTRDYGTWASGGGGGASRLWSTWRPDPGDPVRRYSDMLFFSAYRPPAAVAALAGRQHALPCEILASHPQYNNWVPGGDDAPLYHETQYRSQGFQMGSQVEGCSYDGSGGKVVLLHPERGCDYLIPTSQTKGNPCVGGNDRVAQCRNALLWIGAPREQSVTWRLLLSGGGVAERRGEVVFLKFAEAWAAVRGVRAVLGEISAEAAMPFGKMGRQGLADASGGPMDKDVVPTALVAEGQPKALTGFAIEMADKLHFPDFETFAAAVMEKNRVEAAGNRVSFTAASGAQVALTWDGQARLPQVERDGQPHDWQAHRALWQAGSTGPSPVTLGWKEGVLTVTAGGQRFTGVLDLATGTYMFRNEPAP